MARSSVSALSFPLRLHKSQLFLSTATFEATPPRRKRGPPSMKTVDILFFFFFESSPLPPRFLPFPAASWIIKSRAAGGLLSNRSNLVSLVLDTIFGLQANRVRRLVIDGCELRAGENEWGEGRENGVCNYGGKVSSRSFRPTFFFDSLKVFRNKEARTVVVFSVVENEKHRLEGKRANNDNCTTIFLSRDNATPLS